MPRTGAEVQVRRLLAMVPWIMANDGPTVAEVCRRFAVSEDDLVKDLELLPMCGVAPFTPDQLIEAEIEDGRVWIRVADWFRRPLRLTHMEALTVVASGASLLAAPGTDPSGPLARALDKLAGALGVDPDESLDVALGDVDPDLVTTLRAAVDEQRRVRLSYYSHGRDASTERDVDPIRVFNAEGQWYLRGWCHLATDTRLFRVDRIRRAEILDEAASPPPDVDGAGAVYDPRPDDPVVVLDLEPSAAWVAEQFPHEGVQDLGRGRRRVRLRVSERPWLERLLLQVGPAATVVEGDQTVAAEAARRVLARYGRR